jgi:hypothetical protein
MNTEDIELILNANSTCRQVFQGVFSSNMLPPNPVYLCVTPIYPRNRVDTGLLFMWMMMGEESILIRSENRQTFRKLY